MLDLKFIRENTESVKQAIANRHTDAPIDEILALDERRRKNNANLDELRRRRKEIARLRTPEAIEEGRKLRDDIKSLEDEVRDTDSELKDLLLRVPNMPQDSVPIGTGEEDNKVIRSWGEKREFCFKAKPHWELGEDLGIIDFERGVKLSGTRFYVLNGAGSLLQRSLINFMLDLHTEEHGYKEVYPPFMVKQECMFASGNLPKFADNLYRDELEDYWFVPTAEVPLTNLHRDEILPPATLPINYCAHTACFRREKMSAGKDTRGIKRGHQFDKVELYKFTTPESSNDELANLLRDAETVCQKLGLHYRIVELCTGDLGFGSSKSFDIEVWSPGLEEWLEVSSCSNCLDFQARRASIRFRRSADSKPEYAHTLNGSGLALPRILIAVMESYQQQDGSILLPEVLHKYMNTKEIRG